MPNVTLPKGFAARLRELRLARHLSESDLAEQAGLTYKTIREFETGRRLRAMERTVLAVATALEIPVDELLQTPPAARRRSFRGLALLGGTVLLLAVVLAAGFARDRARVAVEDGVLVARDAVLGLRLWELRSDSAFRVSEVSPWRSDRILVGLGAETPDGLQLLCLDRASGDTVWTVAPDIAAITAAFGEEIVATANFGCARVRHADMDGDGEIEIVAQFTHGLYYPTALCVIDREGRRVAQYAHQGHLNDLLIHDLDVDGRDEVIASGTNNARNYQGATVFVLDQEHRSGASVDDRTHPGVAIRDSSRIRLVLPAFAPEVMRRTGAPRMHGLRLNVFTDAAGRSLLRMEVGCGKVVRVNVTLDADLRPLGAHLTDLTAEHVAGWPPHEAELLDEGAALPRWLDRHLRFGARAAAPMPD